MFPKYDFGKYKQYLSLGAEIAVAISLPLLLGYWLDEKYSTAPYFLLGGMFLGILLLILLFAKIIKNTSGNN